MLRLSFLVFFSTVAFAASDDAPCCTECVAPTAKYYSYDGSHNMCGEACIDPMKYAVYHIFEKNLTKASSNTPCADMGYDKYSSTQTHGVPGLSITVDLYNPSQGGNPAPAQPMTCPSSKAFVHASCKQTVSIQASCQSVMLEVTARVQGQHSAWVDPHNNGTYVIESSDNTSINLQRTTGNGKYTDKLTLTFEAASAASCILRGCSVSQVTSVADFSTNYCNVRNLYCGSAHGCKYVKVDLSSNVTNVSPSLGAGSDPTLCITF